MTSGAALRIEVSSSSFSRCAASSSLIFSACRSLAASIDRRSITSLPRHTKRVESDRVASITTSLLSSEVNNTNTTSLSISRRAARNRSPVISPSSYSEMIASKRSLRAISNASMGEVDVRTLISPVPCRKSPSSPSLPGSPSTQRTLIIWTSAVLTNRPATYKYVYAPVITSDYLRDSAPMVGRLARSASSSSNSDVRQSSLSIK
ncbi:MAG: hypothetical protein A4E30_00418 [Methanomassiliicoccales archaeon PtaB.Bin215]|nr:MAG: hypothetical protein A4E30_00418 [Methanomassiliicoccales archaeon PtaB.Bin215]